MPDTIRIGVVGAGANTRLHHIPKLKKIAGVEIAAVVNRSRASSERAAKELGIPRVHDHWQDLVKDEGIDAVVIGTWPYLHCPITLAALEAGKSADFIVLDANPLDDITHTRRISSVVLRGAAVDRKQPVR